MTRRSIEETADLRPHMLAVNEPEWMAENRFEWTLKHYPAEVWAHNWRDLLIKRPDIALQLDIETAMNWHLSEIKQFPEIVKSFAKYQRPHIRPIKDYGFVVASDLLSARMCKKSPAWMALHRPHAMAVKNATWMGHCRPEWMIALRPSWMVRNRREWVYEYRPEIMTMHDHWVSSAALARI